MINHCSCRVTTSIVESLVECMRQLPDAEYLEVVNTGFISFLTGKFNVKLWEVIPGDLQGLGVGTGDYSYSFHM